MLWQVSRSNLRVDRINGRGDRSNLRVDRSKLRVSRFKHKSLNFKRNVAMIPVRDGSAWLPATPIETAITSTTREFPRFWIRYGAFESGGFPRMMTRWSETVSCMATTTGRSNPQPP